MNKKFGRLIGGKGQIVRLADGWIEIESAAIDPNIVISGTIGEPAVLASGLILDLDGRMFAAKIADGIVGHENIIEHRPSGEAG